MYLYILCFLLPLTIWYGQSFFVTIHMTNLSSSYSIVSVYSELIRLHSSFGVIYYCQAACAYCSSPIY